MSIQAFNPQGNTVTFTADWKAYTQALRDITKQADPNNVTWPQKPALSWLF